MKSEKKSTDLSCVANGIVKEEPCTDPCIMNEKCGGGKNTQVLEGDVKTFIRESNTGSINPEETTIKSNKTGTNNQQAPNSLKLENNSSYPTCNLSNDCGGAAASKSDNNAATKCGRNGPSGGESQFMQQQSQIFVFSTILANKGAEAVLRGQFPSMVAYHCAQPGTRKFLEKHPNKGNKGGQSPAEWLNQFNVTSGQKNQQACPNSFSRQTPELPVLESDSPAFWNEQSNSRNGNGAKSVGNAESSVDDTINKVVNSQPSPNSLGDRACSSPSSLQPSLQGVKVPDENLTPQQRQHREEQLATIRKMHILLFSDRKDGSEGSVATAQGNQTQTFRPDGVNSPAVSPLDNFSSGVDWDKLQNQLIDTKNKVETDNYTPASSGGNAPPVSRSQGPPPPYHQSTRPASVPAALQTSNPSSPNNQTSTLSLPSPRASSALNSPKDCGRQFHHGSKRPGYLPSAGSPMTQDSLTSAGIGRISDGIESHLNHSNPGTPVGSHPNLVSFSPSGASPQKDSIDFPSSQSPSVDDIFCQTLQSVNEEQRDQIGSGIGTKEANLMPVPSPQQIQYLNTFEGQELTIQKQPNTSLKDNESSSSISGNMTTSTMRSPHTENTDRCFTAPLHSPRTPRTPSSNTPFDSATINAGNKVTSDQNSPASYSQNPTDRSRTLPESPKTKDSSPSSNKKQHQMPPGHSNDSKIAHQSNGQDFSCVRPPINVRGQPDNVPLNPNNISSCMGGQGTVNTNFDPITSLAQMSQQLASIAPSNCLGDGPISHSGNLPGIQQGMHSMHEMTSGGGEYGDVGGFPSGLGSCLSTSYNPVPRPGNFAISRPQMAYGPMHQSVYHPEPQGPQRSIDSHNSMRTNVQVKPGAPNTIQYLPAGKPNPCQGGPRPPPSLDFLQGFANPSNQRCFPNNIGPHQGGIHNMPQGGGFPGINRPQRPNGFQTGQNYPHSQMRPQIVGLHQGPSAMRMQHMVGGGVFQGNRMNFDKNFGGGEIMPQMLNPPNPRMYMPGNQGNVMAVRSRAPMQTGMHPGMDGSGNGFKNGPFIGGAGTPTTDPNYAQQYHNFQQQLYATGSRASLPQHGNNIHMGTNSPSFLPER